MFSKETQRKRKLRIIHLGEITLSLNLLFSAENIKEPLLPSQFLQILHPLYPNH